MNVVMKMPIVPKSVQTLRDLMNVDASVDINCNLTSTIAQVTM